MSEVPENPSFSESHLDSAAYRDRLMRKLNCLIAVLEVANAKVRRSLAGPAPDVERLLRIQKNLEDTLDVCQRARSALEKRGALPPELSKDLEQVAPPKLLRPAPAHEPAAKRKPRGRKVEMTSAQERAKFQKLGRIDPRMVRVCDLDELARRLQR